LQPDRISFPGGSRAQDLRCDLGLAGLGPPILRQRSDRLIKDCDERSDGLGFLCGCSNGHICNPATNLRRIMRPCIRTYLWGIRRNYRFLCIAISADARTVTPIAGNEYSDIDD
jgi:hypothetical protein